MKKCFLLFAGFVLFLSGCATHQQKLPTSPTHPTLTTWTIQGKLGINHLNKGTNANLHWHQEASRYTIKLSGPLGQGGLLMEGDAQTVTLTDSTGKQVTISSLDDFLTKRFGWVLPVQSLTFWIKGLPASASTYTASYYEDGLLKTLHQDQWDILYQEYEPSSSGKLPKRMTLTRPGTQLKIYIKTWNI